MKLRMTFQTLILLALAPVLVLLTAFWAGYVYRSTHRIILEGFDRKLLALAGGAAALIDGDAHAAYQRRREIVALAPATDDRLVGVDIALGELVSVNPAGGGARRLAALPEDGIRGLTALGGATGQFGLTSDGGSIVRLDPAGRVTQTVPLGGRVDGICADGRSLIGWLRDGLYRIDADTGALTPLPFLLPETLLSLAVNPATGEWCGLTMDRAELLVLSPEGKLVRRVALFSAAEPAETATAPASARLAPPLVHAVAFFGSQLYASGTSLTKIDPRTGRVDRGVLTNGFFDVEAPFYRRYREAFLGLQRRAGLSYLYTQVYLGEKKIYYILDGTPVEQGYSRPGEGDELPPTSVEAAEIVQFVGRPWVSPMQHWQAWGLLKSCFTPIRSSNGRVIAMAGADVDIGIILGKTRWALFSAILIGVGSLVAAGFVSLRVARALTRPLQQLKESALWIAAGYYGARIEIRGSREVSVLASRLDQLRTRLEEEHQRSRSWLAQLRTQREHTTLGHALDAIVVRQSGLADFDGATGGCAAQDLRAWWIAPPAAATAETAARLTELARQLIATGRSPTQVVAALARTAPELLAVAAWGEASGTLEYRVRVPVNVRLGDAVHRLEGKGRLPLAAVTALRWSVETGPTSTPPPPGGATV